jgi:hypothetical protein
MFIEFPERGPGKTRGAIRFPLIFSPFLIKQKGNEESSERKTE